jgi:RimJ/RimL family protein N-acetyltransferase
VAEAEIVRRMMTEELWVEVLSWRNDPLVYGWTRTNRSITLSEHTTWFETRKKTLNQEPVFAYLINECFVGMARLDKLADGNYEVSLILNPRHRGMGYGKVVLYDICKYFLTNMPSKSKLIAVVHFQNFVSEGLFLGLGFSLLYRDSPFNTFVFRDGITGSL